MSAAALVGLVFPIEEGAGGTVTGTVLGVADWSPEYVLVQSPRGLTCRRADLLSRHLPHVRPNREEAAVAAIPTTEKAAPKKATPKKKAPAKKSPLAKAKEKDDAALAKFLLAHQTYSDRTWEDRAGGKYRRRGESREPFIRRVLLGEEASA